MHSVKGRFYFRKTDAGNLLGEYSNDRSDGALPESALLREPGDSAQDGIVGSYISTWYEHDGNEGVVADLEIRQKTGKRDIYTLTWKDRKTTNLLFVGEAMKHGELLIGDYRSGGSNIT